MIAVHLTEDTSNSEEVNCNVVADRDCDRYINYSLVNRSYKESAIVPENLLQSRRYQAAIEDQRTWWKTDKDGADYG